MTLPAFAKAKLLLSWIFLKQKGFLVIFGAFYGLAAGSYVGVALIDPYRLRPWGLETTLGKRPYADRLVPKLLSVAAQDGTDLMVFGGSTVMGITPAMLQMAFPDSSKPFNLAFAGVRKDDFAVVFGEIERSKTLRRLLLGVDFTLFKDVHWIPSDLPQRFYGSLVWHDPVPEFGLDAIWLSGQVLFSREIAVPSSRRRTPERPDYVGNYRPLTETPLAMNRIRRAIELTRPSLTDGEPLDCSEIPKIKGLLVPFVSRLAARGITVDLFAPPYSLAYAADWSVNFANGEFFKNKATPFTVMEAIRRCVLEGIEAIPNVTFHAFDLELPITGSLSRYYDSVHLFDQSAYAELVEHIARGSNRLSVSEYPAYRARLRDAVSTFSP